MRFYQKFKYFLSIRSPRLKLLLLWMGRRAGMRYYGVFLDPVVACNIRCRMCYFSDPTARPEPQGPMSDEMVARLRDSVFRKALRLQIGCGAEPTLYRKLDALIAAGKQAGVPFVELTTNAQLLTADSMLSACRAGLDGMVLSLHGTTRDTYEYLMKGAKFDRLKDFIEILRQVRREFPDFRLRINYTLNNLNKGELPGLWKLFDGVRIDVVQVRPIQKLGDTEYADFEISDKDRLMSDIIEPFSAECARRGVTALLPEMENLLKVNKLHSEAEELIEQLTYIYVSPQTVYRDDYDCGKETIRRYQDRKRFGRRLWCTVLGRGSSEESVRVNASKKMNYKVK